MVRILPNSIPNRIENQPTSGAWGPAGLGQAQPDQGKCVLENKSRPNHDVELGIALVAIFAIVVIALIERFDLSILF